MRITFTAMVALLMILSSCSYLKKMKGDSDKEAVVADSNYVNDAEDKDLFLLEDEKATNEEKVEAAEQEKEEALEESAPVVEDEVEKVAQQVNGTQHDVADDLEHKEMIGAGEYRVEKGDTLMMIAFKVYGDYTRWRELANDNPSLNSGKLPVGYKIKFQATEKVMWSPSGVPYLIEWGDTLSKISGKVYGKATRWPEIHENNKPMIKDPNLIFAGFTLYYLPEKVAQSNALK